ncbi:MAG: hypothetical protein ACRYGK_01020 [Janthinobacterium lividum]
MANGPSDEEKRENLVKVILKSKDFETRMTSNVFKTIDETITAIRREFQDVINDPAKIPQTYELHYLLASLFAKLSSIDGLGYEEGRGGNANVSVAMFRLLSGYSLAQSLSLGRDALRGHDRNVALNGLETLMTTTGCSGVVSSSLLNGWSDENIGVRVIRMLAMTN